MILESHCQLEQNCLTTGAGNCSVWTRSIFIVCDPTADCGVGNAKLVIAQLRLQLVNPFSAFVAMEGLSAFSWRGLANSIQLEFKAFNTFLRIRTSMADEHSRCSRAVPGA